MIERSARKMFQDGERVRSCVEETGVVEIPGPGPAASSPARDELPGDRDRRPRVKTSARWRPEGAQLGDDVVMTLKAIAAVCALLIAGAGCSADTDDAPSAPSPSASAAELHLTEADLGDDWPLSIDEVTLHCEVSSPYQLVTFDSGGTTYALNGSARQIADTQGWTDFEEVWLADGMGGHVSAQALVDRGLKLCPSV